MISFIVISTLVQHGDTELASPPTDRLSVAYYHYWRFYYQVRLDLVFNRNSRILRPLQGYFAQRHSQWDIAYDNTYDARYQFFHPTNTRGSGWPEWRRRQIERLGSVMSLSLMDPTMAEANEWTGSQRPTLWYMSVHGVRSVYGRLPYLRAPMLHRRRSLRNRRRQWGQIRRHLLEHRQRWERLDLIFVREVGFGAGHIFPTGDLDPQWDYVFPLWESNPAHMLQCMEMIVTGYEVRFDYSLTLTPQIRTLYDRNLTIFLRWRLWRDYYYHPYSDELLMAIFNPVGTEVGLVVPGLDWRFLSPQITVTAEIETPEELDMIGRRWDVRYSLDRITFHRIQHQCLARAASIDIGVLQVVDYINGYGYTFYYRSRAAIIQGASDEMEVTPYRVVSLCAEFLRANDMSVSALCANVATLVRCLRTVIVYLLSVLGIGSHLTFSLLILLHISVYVTGELIYRYLNRHSDSSTLVLGEHSYALMVSTKFNEATDPVFDSGATSHVWNHLSHFTSFRPSTCGCLSIRVANGTKIQSADIGDIGPLKRVLYVPEMAHCLISARMLAADGYEMTTGYGARVTRIGNPNEVLLQSDSGSGLYQITQREFETQLGLCHTACLVHTLNEDNAMKLHYMLGHASAERCVHMCKCTQYHRRRLGVYGTVLTVLWLRHTVVVSRVIWIYQNM